MNLLTRARPGEERSEDSITRLAILENLYDEHHRLAFGLACRILRNQQDAEEVVQEAFLSVWRTMATFDTTRGSTRSWILAAIRNRAIDTIRARKRRPRPDLLEDELPDSECDVAATALASVERESVLYMLTGLPPAQRNAIELAYFGHFSHTEIASRLNVPIGTVKGRIRLGLDHMRRAIASQRNLSLSLHSGPRLLEGMRQ